MRKKSLLDRKGLLEATLPDLERIRIVGRIDDGLMLYKVADGLGLEGIIAKRAAAPYPRGKSGDSVKTKTPRGRHVDDERAKWNER
jgi:ATP-dependent DNA ligase